MAGPLAQSAERGADNAKVVSSTLTRTNQREFFLLWNTIILRNLNSADFFSFFDFDVTFGIYLHQNHLFHMTSLTPGTQQWCPSGD